MITIKQIAEMAKVSRSTVSRALNNSGYISEDARKRIEKVIQETGYLPSEHAKSLRTKKTKVIGVILPTIQTETSSRIVTGVDSILSEKGYQILLANTQLNKEKEIESLNLLKARQVDGIILIATNTGEALQQKIKELSIPIVVIGQEMDNIMSIVYNDYDASRELMSYLISKGHKKVAFIGVSEEDRAVGYLRRKAYEDEMKAHGLEIQKHWIQKAIFDIESGREAMKKIMTEGAISPTAVFAVTDRLAVGALSYMKEQGIAVPSEMALASVGASEISKYIDPPLTTLDYQNETAGVKAATQILTMINGKNYSEKIVLDYRLIKRDSV